MKCTLTLVWSKIFGKNQKYKQQFYELCGGADQDISDSVAQSSLSDEDHTQMRRNRDIRVVSVPLTTHSVKTS
jgi:hypothetical protein